MVKSTKWIVRKGDHEYEALGYESRGIHMVPIAEFINGDCISCDVFEICKGWMDDDVYVALIRPNKTECKMLQDTGWEWDGIFAHRKEKK